MTAEMFPLKKPTEWEKKVVKKFFVGVSAPMPPPTPQGRTNLPDLPVNHYIL